MIAARGARPSRAYRVASALVLLAGATRAAALDLVLPGAGTRVEASGYVDGLAVAPIGGPEQRPQALGALTLVGKPRRNLRLQVTLRGEIGGPFEGGHPGLMNLVHEFQNRTPSLEFNEAFAELRAGDAQLRAGIQKFAWGKLDGGPPTDVLTPRDLHDPFVRNIEESKIGVPAVQLTYYLPPVPALRLSDLRTSLVYIPIAVPPRLPLLQERWFPPTVRAKPAVVVPAATAEDLGLPGNGDVRVPVRFRTLNQRPPFRLDAGGIAARLSGTFRTIDWDVYHYTGPETGPDAELRATVVCDTKTCVDAQGRLKVHAPTFLTQRHDTIHMTGADGSMVLGGLTVRAEVAGFIDRPYLRIASDLTTLDALGPMLPAIARNLGQDLLHGRRGRAPVHLGALFPHRDTIDWGIGADYLIHGFLPLLQVNQVAFMDSGPRQLLSDPETRLLASLRRGFLQDTLELELRGVYAFERAAWFLYPRASYRLGDHWRFRLGYLAIGGPLESVIGQYHTNDEVVMEARYIF